MTTCPIDVARARLEASSDRAVAGKERDAIFASGGLVRIVPLTPDEVTPLANGAVE